MMSLVSVLVILATVLTLAYFGAPLLAWVAGFLGLTVVGIVAYEMLAVPIWASVVTGVIAVLLGLFAVPVLRRNLISDRLYTWFQSVLPRMSDTEREALEAGNTWWDAEIFSGKPRWKKLHDLPGPSLSAEEQAFIDGPVEELCEMLNDWEVVDHWRDLPEEAWKFIKEKGFLSMIIPKEYGGLEFSHQAHSAVVMKLASRNLTAAVTVMVPNSLGPGELLLHYGTEEQKNHYLPRLADGRDIPAFGLTSPHAGSDAAAMVDRGVICWGEHEGEKVLGMKVTWNKRYITLAPVATVIGLAFKAYDPDGLIGDQKELGITCALIPAETPGVHAGRRHMPVGAVFMNGPTSGEDVFIPLDWVIGGKDYIGKGWTMLMQSLAVGRAISLPALGVSGGKMSALTTGAYSRIRKQFKMPIAYFEGIEEPLAKIAGYSYRMDSARKMTLIGLDMGEKPSVLSAIVKYHLTEGNRVCINEAMDVHGGKSIIQGPSNYLAHAYQAIPISITVEGANILTRSMIIFGQGAIRSHPYLLKEMQAAADDSEAGRKAFDKALWAHIGYVGSNKVRAFILGITGARFARSPVSGPTARFYRQLTRMCAAFTFVADSVLLILGGKFKFKEKMSGRLADVLSHIYMSTAVLKRFRDDGEPKEDLPFVTWALEDSLYTIQSKLDGVLKNFPISWMGPLIKTVIFPFGKPYLPPSDSCGKHVARLLIADSPSLQRLTSGVYRSENDDAVGRLMKAFRLVLETAPIERAIKNALDEVINIGNYQDLTQRAVEAGAITETDAARVQEAQELVRRVIEVDDFPRSKIESVDDPLYPPITARAS